MEQTPPEFTFAVKASRYLTHMRRMREVADGVRLFYERVDPLVRSGKLGPVVWQLPPNFRRDDERLAAILGAYRGAGTASSSATRAGSPSRCTSCCASTTRRS